MMAGMAPDAYFVRLSFSAPLTPFALSDFPQGNSIEWVRCKVGPNQKNKYLQLQIRRDGGLTAVSRQAVEPAEVLLQHKPKSN